ncbi:hypothetical protein COU60_03165 [Candidatus Pacearchaeota archaeon CG10_big_fil_rev_8_21_14_0_10_34_76]|nr:MAG: hypothetical protein COU60_03165 [Candidatus Pacearchaeota archaeon CG10_big_fil_rev_8_21_14_0_10_34_76]
MEDIIVKIKNKKEFRDIPDSFISDLLDSYISKNNIKEIKGKKQEKFVLKEIRAELRKYTGQYQHKQIDRKSMLKKGEILEILKSHTSTKERLDFYPALKEKIKKISPKSILDLGCGLNPIALASPDVTYYACDIKESELELINDFFKMNKLKGNAFYFDLRKEIDFPKSDLCLIFKVFDIIESKGHKIAEKILTGVNCNWMIISFSTRKISGKRMASPRRQWFDKLLSRLKYDFETFSSENEFFYIIKKYS